MQKLIMLDVLETAKPERLTNVKEGDRCPISSCGGTIIQHYDGVLGCDWCGLRAAEIEEIAHAAISQWINDQPSVDCCGCAKEPPAPQPGKESATNDG